MAQRPASYRKPRRGGGTGTLPPEITRPIATTGDGRDITRPWRQLLEEARDPRLMESVDWGVYERIAQDPEVRSTFQQRRRAVTSAEWDVIPGDDKDQRSVDAADQLKANLEEVGLDRVTEKMLWCVMNGYAVAELGWGPWNGMIGFVPVENMRPIHVRHARRFRKDRDGMIRLLTSSNMTGEVMPARKFWWVSTGSSDDDDYYGRGLAADLYWPVKLKRDGFGFWAIALDKFGSPTAMGTYNRGAAQADIDKLLQALEAIATDSGFVIPEGMKVELLKAATSAADFETLIRICDEYIDKVVLSQTMTTNDGSSNAQAQVHAGVKSEVVTGDADLVCESFNEGPARWWTDLNYGADVAAPQLVRLLDPEEDLAAQATTDGTLAGQGWVRTEESFRDVYGDGYERKAPIDPGKPQLEKDGRPVPADEAGGDRGRTPAGEADTNVIPFKAVSFAAFTPRPLYVHRQLRNTGDLLAWAKQQGFTKAVDAADLHVTVTYSRTPCDWFAMGGSFGPATGELTVPAGGARVVQALGDKGAVVLMFASPELEWRHTEMVDAGASWDFDTYHPHVTITYDGAGVDLAAVEPYLDKLVFGPEIFEAIDENWSAQVTETSFAEAVADALLARRDVVDGVVDDLIAGDGYTALSPIMAPIADAIAKSGSAAELDEALIRSLGQSDVDQLTDALARAGFAIRVAADAGADTTSDGVPA